MSEWTFDEVADRFAGPLTTLIAENFFTANLKAQRRILTGILSKDARRLFDRQVSGEKVLAFINLVSNPRYMRHRLKGDAIDMILDRKGGKDAEHVTEVLQLIEKAGDAGEKALRLLREGLKKFYKTHAHPNRITIRSGCRPELESGGKKTTKQGITVAIANWDKGRWFEEIIEDTKALQEATGTEELNILTTHFNRGIGEMGRADMERLEELLAHGVKVNILLMDPRHQALMKARFGLRIDEASDDEQVEQLSRQQVDAAMVEAYKQIRWLSDRQAKYRNLEVRLSQYMPLGFVVLNSRRALLGLFVASASFTEAPIIKVEQSTQLWKALKTDWKRRWPDSKSERDIVTIDLETFRAFDEFFGGMAAARAGEAKIIVQEDRIERLVASTADEELISQKERSFAVQIGRRPWGRLFKARQWVNQCDLEGGNAIRDEFHAKGIPAPELMQIPRQHDKIDRYAPNAPFAIAMGLGFTDETADTVEQRYDAWMHILHTKEYGDVLSLHKKLVTEAVEKHIQEMGLEFRDNLTIKDKDPKQFQDFRHLVPQDWTVEQWLADDRSLDYGIILRYTVRAGRPRFVIAGFTERATAVAGRYLAEKWMDLRNRVSDLAKEFKGVTPARQSSPEDFLAVITGPSDPYITLDKWSPVNESLILIPKVVEAAGLKWRRRS